MALGTIQVLVGTFRNNILALQKYATAIALENIKEGTFINYTQYSSMPLQ